MVGELIMKLLHARTAAHVLHLRSRSYSAHMALGDFYEEVVDFADSIAEAWQGDYGLIEDFPARYTPYTDPLKLLEDLGTWVEEHRAECGGASDTHIQSIIDEVVALIRRTQYKLRFLK